MNDRPIIFFDGVCNLCDSFVRFLIKIDKKDKLRFASLQGETAKTKLPETEAKGLGSVVFYKDGERSHESQAVIDAFKVIGGPWTLFAIFQILPSPLRDLLYRFIAKNRYKWFGKKDEVCPMPTKAQREKVLP